MGANDAKEMLEAAKAECLRLERENTRLADALAAVPAPTEADREMLRERIIEAMLLDSFSADRVERMLERPQNPQTHKAARLADAILSLIPVPAPKTQDGESREALAAIVKRVIDVEVMYDDDDWNRIADAILARYNLVPVSQEGGETK